MSVTVFVIKSTLSRLLGKKIHSIGLLNCFVDSPLSFTITLERCPTPLTSIKGTANSATSCSVSLQFAGQS
jgi:hypothetical protein